MFGPALIDKAILDALLRACRKSFAQGMRENISGLDARLAPDVETAAIEDFLRSRETPETIAIRHTVGLDDYLGELEHEIVSAGVDFLKIKLCGDPDKDADRLALIGAALDRSGRVSGVTLDANEQYSDMAALADLCDRLGKDALAPIVQRLLFVEQPLSRDDTFRSSLGPLAGTHAFIIDEADDSWNSFVRARALDYRGTSAKSCKGIYKAIVNATRAEVWSAQGCGEFFISAEDLTCQAGLAVQQDLAVAAFIGATHVERNGHHYVDGFADTPAGEAEAFLAAHPDLYERIDGRVKLRTGSGALSLKSLDGIGFASGAMPRWADLTPLRHVATSNIARESIK